MFVQIIEGKVLDRDAYTRGLERWRQELKPGAKGFLGATGGVADDGTSIELSRWESREAAEANAARPEQDAWWNEFSKCLDGEGTFHDCDDVDLLFGGGRDDAGFVQFIIGRATDKDGVRKAMPEMEGPLREARPDLLGGVMAWDGDWFCQAAYFSSEGDARKGEREERPSEADEQWFSKLVDLRYIDIRSPDFD